MNDRLKRIKEMLDKEHDLAVEEKDYDSARQINFARKILINIYDEREFEDEYDQMKYETSWNSNNLSIKEIDNFLEELNR